MPTATLTDADIRRILLTENTARAMAKELGVTHQMVSAIRRGERFAHMASDLPRWKPQPRNRSEDKTCSRCIHWLLRRNADGQLRPVCSLEFPEARRTRGAFARYCNAFAPSK